MPSTITSANNEAHEFVSANMFSSFVSRYQSQMDMVQNSLKTLNDSFNESFYYEEDYEEVSKENVVHGKRNYSNQVNKLDFSAKRSRRDDHEVSDVVRICVEDLGGTVDCAGAKAGESEADVIKSSDEMSNHQNINNVSGAQCLDALNYLNKSPNLTLKRKRDRTSMIILLSLLILCWQIKWPVPNVTIYMTNILDLVIVALIILRSMILSGTIVSIVLVVLWVLSYMLSSDVY